MYANIVHIIMSVSSSTDQSIQGVESGLCLDGGVTANCQKQPWSTYPYCDPNLDPTTRASDLVHRMTIMEKV